MMYYTAQEAQGGMSVLAGWLGKNYKVKVVYHDGNAVDANIETGTIRIPKLACASGVTEEAVQLLRSMVYHESGHIAETKLAKSETPHGALFSILNALEDRRIERVLSEAHLGCKDILAWAVGYYNKRIAGQIASGSVNAPLWEALCAMGMMVESQQPAWRLTPKAAAYVKAAYDEFSKVRDAKNTKDCLEIAKRIHALVKDACDEFNKNQKQEQQEQGKKGQKQDQKKGKEQDKEQDKGEEGEEGEDGKDGESKSEKNEKKGSKKSGKGGKDESKDEENESKEPKGKGKGKGKDKDAEQGNDPDDTDSDKGDKDDAKSEKSDKGDEKSDGSDSDEDGDAGDESEGDKDGNGAESDLEDETNKPDDSGDGNEDDGTESEGSKGGSEESKGSESEGVSSDDDSKSSEGKPGDSDKTADSDSPYQPNDIEDGDTDKAKAQSKTELEDESKGSDQREILNERLNELFGELSPSDKSYLALRETDIHRIPSENQNDRETFIERRTMIASAVSSMTRALEQALRSMAKTRKDPYLRQGKIDKKRLVAISKSLSKEVFCKTRPGEDMDVAVEIIIDESGSMGNWIHVQLIAIAIGEALSQIGIPFEITGTTTRFLGGCSCPQLGGFTRTNPIVYQHYKDFSENWIAVKHRIVNTGSHNHNVDGEAVEFAAYRLAQRKEMRKVIFSLSDGEPCAGHGNDSEMGLNLKRVCERVRKSGIEVYGFGIGTEAPAKFYGRNFFVYLRDFNLMGQDFIRKVVDVITAGRVRV